MQSSTPLPSGSREDHVALIRRAIDNSGAETVRELVLGLLGDALEAVRRIPDSDRRFLAMGTRSTWRDIGGSSAQDVADVERSRVLSGVQVNADKMMQSARGVEDHLLALEWLRWIRAVPRDPGLHDGIVLLLSGDHRQKALEVWRPNRKYSRTSIRELRGKAVQAVVKGLARTFDIDVEEIFRSTRAA